MKIFFYCDYYTITTDNIIDAAVFTFNGFTASSNIAQPIVLLTELSIILTYHIPRCTYSKGLD